MSTHITCIWLQVVCVVFACAKIFQILLNYFCGQKITPHPASTLLRSFTQIAIYCYCCREYSICCFLLVLKYFKFCWTIFCGQKITPHPVSHLVAQFHTIRRILLPWLATISADATHTIFYVAPRNSRLFGRQQRHNRLGKYVAATHNRGQINPFIALMEVGPSRTMQHGGNVG